MPTPLELAVAAAVQEQNKLNGQLNELMQALTAKRDECSILHGRIEQLEKELHDSKVVSDHNLQWAAEVTSQLHSVGLFVSDALDTARVRVHEHRTGARHDDINKALNRMHDALGLEHQPDEKTDGD